MDAPATLAVIRFGGAGDVLLATPVLEALSGAWPSTRILFVVKAPLAPLVAHHPAVHQVVTLAPGESPWSLARRLRERGASAVLDLHGKIRSKLLHAALPGLPWATWHKRDLAETVAVKLAGRRPRVALRQADRYHAAAERLVGRPLPRGCLRHHLGPEDRAVAGAALREAGANPDRPFVVLSPGAAWATKRWPPERYGALAAHAIAAGFQVAVPGSAAERPLAARIREVAPQALDLSGRLDLGGLAGLLDRCRAFAGNDSGPMHLARALGVPTLAFFGSTDPAMFDLTDHRPLYRGLSCSPCSFYGRSRCPEGHFQCMLGIDAETAWQAFLPLLAGARRPPPAA